MFKTNRNFMLKNVCQKHFQDITHVLLAMSSLVLTYLLYDISVLKAFHSCLRKSGY